jgi:very-short-patch-repair endonuclease
LPRKKQERNVGRARQLRRKMTLPEVLLWQILRQEPDGVKFRRQHSTGDYYLDFYCAKAKVCIEVDGIVHDMGNHPEHDIERSEWLRAEGIEVLRVPARDVLRSPEEVAEALVRYCKR